LARALAVAILLAAPLFGQSEVPFVGGQDHPAIGYAFRPAENAVSALDLRLAQGAAPLRFVGASGYLHAVLEALEVPLASQIAVFSKTSLQQALISPKNPRFLYFNDRAVVAWVRGEPFVEVAAVDARQGVIFYTVDQTPASAARFTRRDSCTQCHVSYATVGVPGMLIRSAFPAPSGEPLRQLGDYLTDHRSPWQERMGGWYVTGHAPAMHHMGNTVVADGRREKLIPAETSDIVALLVFQHQMRMTNLITRLGWEARAGNAVEAYARELVDYLLFADEPPLPGPVQGASGFAEQFASRGALRDFDLSRYLFRYPCSYMIYSPSFDALPSDALDAVYRRLWHILSGRESGARYARLTPAACRAILRILRETKPHLPEYFH
jgi:hypothetical protein